MVDVPPSINAETQGAKTPDPVSPEQIKNRIQEAKGKGSAGISALFGPKTEIERLEEKVTAQDRQEKAQHNKKLDKELEDMRRKSELRRKLAGLDKAA